MVTGMLIQQLLTQTLQQFLQVLYFIFLDQVR